MLIRKFSFPTSIHFGPGASRLVAAHLKERNQFRPLVVTDKGLATLPVFSNFLATLTTLNVQVSSSVSSNPVKSEVAQGVAAFKKHNADSIIGFGGGAALDVAKAIALMANHPGDLFDYEDEKPNARPVDREIPYFVALPTTAGTGSEVGRSAVISDDATHTKKIIFSPRLLAQTVFADPELTLELPAKITAATGMDALTHNVEAFLAKEYHPICEGIALEGLRLCQQHLANAVREPTNLEARAGMLMASMMGAIAFQKGLGLTHSCAHPLSTVANLHHGLANAIMITFALPFNVSVVPEKFARLAQAVEARPQDANGFFAWLKDLRKQIAIPPRLSEVGIKREQIDCLADLAIADTCHPNNPRPMSREDFKQIFTAAL